MGRRSSRVGAHRRRVWYALDMRRHVQASFPGPQTRTALVVGGRVVGEAILVDAETVCRTDGDAVVSVGELLRRAGLAAGSAGQHRPTVLPSKAPQA